MFDLRSETMVSASVPDVWDVLADLANHSTWAPKGGLDGRAEPGRPAIYNVGLQDWMGQAQHLRFEGVIKTVDPERRLEWVGGVAGITRLTLTFDLAPMATGTCVRQHLRLSGLAPLVFRARFEAAFSPAVAAFSDALLRRFPVKGPAPSALRGKPQRRKPHRG